MLSNFRCILNSHRCLGVIFNFLPYWGIKGQTKGTLVKEMHEGEPWCKWNPPLLIGNEDGGLFCDCIIILLIIVMLMPIYPAVVKTNAKEISATGRGVIYHPASCKAQIMEELVYKRAGDQRLREAPEISRQLFSMWVFSTETYGKGMRWVCWYSWIEHENE